MHFAKMKYVISGVFLIVFGQIFAATVPKVGETANINIYVDALLDEIREWAQATLNPIPLPDITEEMQEGIISGKLELTQGQLFDLATVQRNGDCVIDYTIPLETASTTLNVLFPDIRIVYNFHAELIISVYGNVEGLFDNTGAILSLGFDLENLVSIKEFTVDTGSISLDFHDNALIDWLLELVSSVLVRIFHDTIDNALNVQLRNALDQVLILVNEKIQEAMNNGDEPVPPTIDDVARIFEQTLLNTYKFKNNVTRA